MSRFFINRPNFAIVVALFMTIVGAIALKVLPVGQYPNVAPPTVMVYVTMDGGSTDVMQKSVATLIEKEVNGVEGMTYMKSNIGNDGSYGLEIQFEIGLDADRAVTLVQNRVNKTVSNLPEGARRYGVTVEKVSSGMLMAFSVRDDSGRMDDIELSNWTSMMLFLQSWRVTLITIASIPVSLITTFAIMLASGMTINIVSMFGLILAIGIVVDAAIIVIENIERLWEDDPGLSVRDAVLKSMEEVTGPIIASMLVLLSVFGPTLFMPGMTGILYGQFGIAISAAVVVSTVVALVLTPVLCMLLMKQGESKKIWLYRVFDKGVNQTRDGFGHLVNFFGRRLFMSAALILSLFGSIWLLGNQTSTGFLPDEDKGTLFAVVMLPDGSALHRTDSALETLSDQMRGIEGIKSVVTVAGFNLITNSTGPNAGLMLITLDEYEKRQGIEALSLWSVLGQTQGILDAEDKVFGMAFPPPAIPELGLVAGFDLMFKDTQARDPVELAEASYAFIEKINADPRVVGAYTTFTANTPNIKLEIDREKIKMMGLQMDQVFNTIQAQFAGAYSGKFNMNGRNFFVFVQAEQTTRKYIEDLNVLTVRNQHGELINISSIVTPTVVFGPQVLQQFNLNQAVNINGYPAPGYSSGDAIKAVEEAAEALPAGYEIEWAGLTKQELAAGNSAVIAFALAILFTYLLLVAQYESWVIALCIILSVPTAALGTLGIVFLMGTDVNLYVQIAMVLLVGMSARNAILIVEFAKKLREEEGYGIVDAAVTATRMRFRAVMMTALSFVFGLFPLMFSTGAGYAAQQSIGWAACGGMVSATFLGMLVVPVIYVLLQTVRERVMKKVTGSVPAASVN